MSGMINCLLKIQEVRSIWFTHLLQLCLNIKTRFDGPTITAAHFELYHSAPSVLTGSDVVLCVQRPVKSQTDAHG